VISRLLKNPWSSEARETDASQAPEERAAETYWLQYVEQQSDKAAWRSERIACRSAQGFFSSLLVYCFINKWHKYDTMMP
jgi:hypothetical protein